jgi:hypothetical protein
MNSLKIVLGPRKTWNVEYDTFSEQFEFKNLNKTQNTAVKRWWDGGLMQGEREALVGLA